MEPVISLADRFRHTLRALQAGPAPLYVHLVDKAISELERPSRFRGALEPFEQEPPRRLLPLRLLALVHRGVLAGQLRELALHYPSAGGRQGPEGAWPLFREAVVAWRDYLPDSLAPPHQHNEVTRAAALAGGFLLASKETGLPMRLLEVGASAGLLLRWDHYLNSWWFPQMFDSVMPRVEGQFRVEERRGCDLNPIELTQEGVLLLRSLVWADLVDHLRILDEAIEIGHRVPVAIDPADGADWLPQHAMPQHGAVTVLFHSLMQHAGPPDSLDLMEETILTAGGAATPSAPFGYLRFEAPDQQMTAAPDDPRRLVHVRLTMWPGGRERLLATADVNGRHVRWLAADHASATA